MDRKKIIMLVVVLVGVGIGLTFDWVINSDVRKLNKRIHEMYPKAEKMPINLKSSGRVIISKHGGIFKVELNILKLGGEEIKLVNYIYKYDHISNKIKVVKQGEILAEVVGDIDTPIAVIRKQYKNGDLTAVYYNIIT